MMKNRLSTRFTAFVLTVVLLLTSNVLILHAFSSEPPKEIGINNHVMTADASADTKYVLQFYKHDEHGNSVIVPFPSEMQIVGSKYLTPDTIRTTNDCAYIFLGKDEEIVFSDSASFNSFLRSNKIDKITISYEPGYLNHQETSLLYGPRVRTYDFWQKEELVPVEDFDPEDPQYITVTSSYLDYDSSDLYHEIPTEFTCEVEQFDSTKMTTVTVTQEWRDRGVDRPEIGDVSFDLLRDGDTYLVHNGGTLDNITKCYNFDVIDPAAAGGEYNAYLKQEVANSSTYQYSYIVPECAPNGDTYTYTSKQYFPQEYASKYSHDNDPANNEYLAIGYTDFTFTLNWSDAYDSSARPQVDAQFIKDNFTLYKKSGNTEEAVAFWPYDLGNGPTYYVVGNFNDWTPTAGYELRRNGAQTGAEEYFFENMPLNAGDEFKIVKVENGEITWYPSLNEQQGAASNYVVAADDTYNVYFRPNGDGDPADWHYNVIYTEPSEGAVHPISDYLEIPDVPAGSHTMTIKVKSLEDITEEGTANEYYLKLNSGDRLPLNQESTLPHREELDLQNDFYYVRSENTGLHINETDTTYDLGEIDLLLTGATRFSVDVEWKDSEKQDERRQDSEAASISLWRYSWSPDQSAIIDGPHIIDGSRDSQTITFSNHNKYDLTGQIYTYYAVEKLTVDEMVQATDEDGIPLFDENDEPIMEESRLPYIADYHHDDPDLKKAFDGGTITNRLTDKIEFTVSADWIAAARQGGTAEAVYQLQRKSPDDDDFEPVMVDAFDPVTGDPILDPVTGEQTQKPMELTITYDEKHMSRSGGDECTFPEVDVYDENGKIYRYRVVQTLLTRNDIIEVTDENQQTIEQRLTDTYGDDEGEDNIGEQITGSVTTEEAEIRANDEYLVTLTQRDEHGDPDPAGTDFHFLYVIQGDTKIRIEKEWVTRDGSPVDASDPRFKADFDVQNFNIESHQYRDYFVESEYPDGFFDSYLDSGYFIRMTKEEYLNGISQGGSDGGSEGGSEGDPQAPEYYIVFNQDTTILNHANNNTVVDGKNVWVIDEIPVPKYDNEGHEIAYRSIEIGKEFPPTAIINGVETRVGYYSKYSWKVINEEGTLKTKYQFHVQNIQTTSGGDYAEIGIQKEWIDDGELEFRRPIKIIASDNVYQNSVRSVSLDKENVWEGRIPVNFRYVRDPVTNEIQYDGNGNPIIDNTYTYQYDPADFSESALVPDEAVTYWSKEQIEELIAENNLTFDATIDPDTGLPINPETGQTLDPELEWIYQLLTDTRWVKLDSDNNVEREVDYSNTSDLNGGNSVDLRNLNPINFPDFAGIYKSASVDGDPRHCHYYAVRQEKIDEGINDTLYTVRFINTRIGVINYEVLFDWKVGDAIAQMGESDLDKEIKTVTIKITGDGLPGGYIEKTVSPNELLPVTKDGKTYYGYYMLNLPKYDENGKLIDYHVEEVRINNESVDDNGEVNVGVDDHCVVKVSSESVTEGSKARSDDLHTVTITNTFKDEDTLRVHKRWVDDSNNDNTRTDLYIRLYRISKKPGSVVQQVLGDLGEDYKWERRAGEEINYWTYIFEDLPKYDAEGYPYTYFVREQDELPGYRQEYENHATYTDPEDDSVTLSNPKVYIPDAILAAGAQIGTTEDRIDFDEVVFNEGTITNRLYGELTIDGEKLWQNISSILAAEDYPIANVSLYRDLSSLSAEDLEKLAQTANLTADEKRDREVLIAETTVRSGANAFKFTDAVPDAISRRFIITERDSQSGTVVPKITDGNIVLPKYDELGIRLAYKLKEEPINGYLSKIEQGSQKLINEYHGGRPLAFEVTKKWMGMENETIFPTIKITLHQVFKVNEGTAEEPRYKYYEMNHFEREIRTDSLHDIVVNFPDASHPEEAKALHYYSPIGHPYTYFVTETLSNYDGEQVLYIEDDMRELIPEYLEPYENNPKAVIVTLDTNGSGKELGFSAQILDTLGTAEDAIRDELTDTENNITPSEDEVLHELNDYSKKDDPVELDETIQNTYQPDVQNFQGKLNVTKTWDNQQNSDYDQIRKYDFTLKRHTKLVDEETLFKVETIDALSGEGALPHITNLAPDIKIDEDYLSIHPHDFLPSMSPTTVQTPEENETPRYYIAVLLKDHKAITVVIDARDNFKNSVSISGLAIYGHDALKYYYTVVEDPKPGYTVVRGTGTAHLNNEPDPEEIPVIGLENKLDIGKLKIYKTFGREYQDSENDDYIEPIPVDDFQQFFNDEYVKQLTFNLYRQSSVEASGSLYRTISGSDILSGNDDTVYLDRTKNAYFYTFENLPLTDFNGNYYTYWIQEVDGAQSSGSDKVFTQYSHTQLEEGKTAELVTVAQDDIEFTASDIGSSEVKETYVQNVFKAKKININKYWLDNNNEDGLRPTSLNVTVTERLAGAATPDEISFDYTLTKENAVGEIGWKLEAALARYYFNGSEAIDGLQYRLTEESLAEIGYTIIETAGTYGKTDANDPVTYLVSNTDLSADAPVSDSAVFRAIGENALSLDTFDDLNLTNYKIPQKGDLSLQKNFTAADERFKADTRPANLYFKLYRNGVPFTEYDDLFVTLKIGDTAADAVDVTANVLAANGLITLSRYESATVPAGRPDLLYLYPNIYAEGLPLGSSTDGGVQQNGTFVADQYKFVECDENGNVLTGSEDFPYSWSGNGPTGSDTVSLKNAQYANSYDITNRLKTEDHTVKKKWNDDANNGIPNYYHTRTEEFHVTLQRITEDILDPDHPDVGWEDVPGYVDVKLDTDVSSIDYVDYTRYFSNLPKYNSENLKYYYRVVETYIGSDDPSYNGKYATTKTANVTVGGVTYTYPATHVYYVDYDNPPTDEVPVDPLLTEEELAEQRLTDTTTWIDNHLIRKTEYQNFIVDKTWVDNQNQDGKRTPIRVVLEQYIQKTGQEKEVVNTLPVILNEENNWYYKWSNRPLKDSDGNLYHYDIYEDTTVDGYDQDISGLIHSPDQTGEQSYEMRQLTNTHSQEVQSLNVDKKWLNENLRDKQLRPESLTFVLYCQYTAYKYVSEDPDTGDQTDLTTDEEKLAALADGTLKLVEDPAKSYDGPVENATQLRAYYPDTAKNDAYDPANPSGEQYYFQKTLTPADKTDDAQWQNAITFDNLPVYINTCGDARWDGQEYAIQYYVKELEPTTASGINPYDYGVTDTTVTPNAVPYKAQKQGYSPATTLLNGTTASDMTVTAANELKTRNITVTKYWQDNSYGDSLHYDIDFTLTCTNANESFAYTETQTLRAHEVDSDLNPVLSVRFMNLPIYRKDGTMLEYEVTEKAHVDSGVAPDVKYGYVQSAPVPDIENGVLYGYRITNTLPVIRFKADKQWLDNNNQDGQRPDTLNVSLTGQLNATTAINIPRSDASSEHEATKDTDTLWQVDFGIRPRYDESNSEIVYTAAEAAASGAALNARGYTRYNGTYGEADYHEENNYSITIDPAVTPDPDIVSVTTESGVTVKTYHFKNRYVPQKDDLKVRKSWVNTVTTPQGVKDYAAWAQPASVSVSLCYEYNGTVVNLATLTGNSDPVKQLFPSGYQFTRTLAAGVSWQDVFDDLPLYVNPTGTVVFNGESYQIRYSVVEAALNGYTTTYAPTYQYPNASDPNAVTLNGTALNGLSGAANQDELTVTNTLKTKTVLVQKRWEDGVYRGNEAKHYDVDLLLAKTADATKILTDTISAATTGITASTTVNGTVTFTVPQYNADGTPANYTVTETNQQYGYVTTYTDNHIFDAAGNNAIADNEVITVINTLPLTTVSVAKQWADGSDSYSLRPASFTVHMKRRPVTNNGAAWASADAGWTNYDATVTTSNSTASDGGNTWTYQYDKLPRYDEHNIRYEYKVIEDQVNAYDTAYLQPDSSYSTSVVTADDNTAASGSDSSLTFGVRNTLITEPITVVKIWKDNDYANADALHYPVNFTVSNPGISGFTFDDIAIELSSADKDNARTAANNGLESWAETTVAVPVYDTNGNPIRYAVTEQNAHRYGYHQVDGTVSGTGELVNHTVITRDGTHTGNGIFNGKFYDTYSITNELPLTEVSAVKHWNGDLEMYPNGDVTVNLTRASQNTQDLTFNADTANTKVITYAAGAPDDSVTFEKLLVYDIGNHPYTYTVNESTVTGYSTAYTNQNVSAEAVSAADRTVTIANTPLKGSADFVKYDLTDLERHGTDSRFTLSTIPGAEFELHRVLNGNDKKIIVNQTVSGRDGSYVVVDSGTSAVITSGADGKISFTNLEPNRYYLIETNTPTGFQPNTDAQDEPHKYYFTVGVNAQNTITVTYDDQKITKGVDGKLKLAGSDLSTDDAIETLADFSDLTFSEAPPSSHGIPNEENMSHLTLTKVDSKNQAQPLPNATYYLLRLYNYEYRKPGAQGSNEAEYLAKALEALTADDSATSPLWTYWEKIFDRQTDANGKITAEGHMFGTYVFYEVKAPVGYERDFTHDGTTNSIGPVTLHSGNAEHDAEVHNLTHLEPHKTAKIKILKTDENGNPLKGATFNLYKVKSGAETDDTLITTVTTDYDGMNLDAIELDPEHYNWGQAFYFLEVTPPKGYSADNHPVKSRISFTLTPELADETLHIERANDARLKGKVDLTKVSSATTSAVTAGDPLEGAVFELYTKSGVKQALYPHRTSTSTFRVVYDGIDVASDTTAAGFDPTQRITEISTDSIGKLHIEGIDWGDYYLREKTAPTGFKLPGGEEEKRVYFTVGRNNSGDIVQQLVMKNEPLTAKLNISKHIDQYNEAAWGKPTFIFKIRQTAAYNHADGTFTPILPADSQPVLTKTISPVTPAAGGYEDATGAFDIEPGEYIVTEVRVARYAAAADSVTTEIPAAAGKVTVLTNTKDSATLRILPDGEALVRFTNELRNYEKLNHVDQKTNRFNGYKAVKVGDLDNLTLDTPGSNYIYSLTIPKSDLVPVLIKSDDTTTPVTDYSKLAITALVKSDGTVKPIDQLTQPVDEITVTDNGSTITVKGRLEDVSGSVYQLRAVYDGKFSDDFELRFAANPLFDKSEKRVTFHNDASNQSYYVDGASHNGVYTLIYIMEKPDTVKRILHNGSAIFATGTAAFPTLYIDELYSGSVEFDHWVYSYTDNGTVVSGNADSNQLLSQIIAAPNNVEISVTPVLRPKSSTP